MTRRAFLIALSLAVCTPLLAHASEPGHEAVARRVAEDLGITFEEALAPKSPTDTASRLKTQLSRLRAVQKGARTLDPLIQRGVLHSGALAWVHAWGALGRLLNQEGAHVAELTTLNQGASLGLLLDLYGTLTKNLEADRAVFREFEALASGGKLPARLAGHLESESDPLLLALWLGRESNGSWVGALRLREYWGRGHQTPSTAHLVGQPQDPPSLRRGVLTLWSLVNRRLDQTGKTGAKLPLLTQAKWLVDLGERAKDAGFCSKPTQPELKSLAAFLRFRHHIQTSKGRTEVVDALHRHRIATAGHADIDALLENPELPALKDLLLANEIVEGRSLPQADIWLNYLLLRSYRNDGLAGVVHPNNGIEEYWSTSLRKYRYRPKSPPSPTPKAPVGGGASRLPPPAPQAGSADYFVRWNTTPAVGHPDRALGDLVQGTIEYLDLQRLSLKFWAENPSAKAADVELKTRLKRLAPIRSRLAPYSLGMPAPGPHFSSEAPRNKSVDRDLRALWAFVNAISRRLNRAASRVGADGKGSSQWLTLAALGSSGSWSSLTYPSKSVDAYKNDLDEQIKALKRALDATALRADLTHDYRRAREAYERGRWAEKQAVLATRIAEKATSLAKRLVEIGQRNINLGKLVEKARVQIANAHTLNVMATEERRALAQEIRVTAAAQLVALRLVHTEAAGVIKDAQESLQKKRGELLALAGQLDDAAKNKELFALAKAIVAIVGIVAAPFTGGGSLSVAFTVVKGLDIAEQLSQADWSSPAAAIGNVANAASSAIDLVAAIPSPGQGKKAQADYKRLQADFASAKKFVNFHRDGALLVLSLTEGGNFTSVAQRLTAFAANNVTTEMRGGKLWVDVAGGGMEVKLPGDVAKELKGVITEGGVLLTKGKNLLNRLQSIGPLLEKAAKEAGAGFPKELKDVLDRFPAAKARLEKAIDILPSNVRTEMESQLRDLAKNKLPIVIGPDGKLRALVPKSAAQLAKKTLERIKGEVKSFAKDRLKDLLGKLNAAKDRLHIQIQQIEGTKNPKAIRNFATHTLPASITDLETELFSLDARISAADAQNERLARKARILGLEAQATVNLAKAAKIQLQAAKDKIETLKQEKRVEELRETITKAELKLAGMKLKQAIDLRSSLLEEVLHSYRLCRAAGIDPNAKSQKPVPPDDLFSLEPIPGRPGLRRALLALRGLVRWIQFCGPEGRGAKRLKELNAKRQTLWLLLGSAGGSKAADDSIAKAKDELSGLGKDLHEEAKTLLQNITVLPGAKLYANWGAVGEGKVTWSQGQRVLRFVFNVKNNENKRLYVMWGNSAVIWPKVAIAKGGNLKFHVRVRPPLSVRTPWLYQRVEDRGSWKGDMLARSGDLVLTRAGAKQTAAQVQKDFIGGERHPYLFSAEGAWTFEIWIDKDVHPDTLERLRKEPKISLELVFFEISGKTKK
jgi:hypothetical protein